MNAQRITKKTSVIGAAAVLAVCILAVGGLFAVRASSGSQAAASSDGVSATASSASGSSAKQSSTPSSNRDRDDVEVGGSGVSSSSIDSASVPAVPTDAVIVNDSSSTGTIERSVSSGSSESPSGGVESESDGSSVPSPAGVRASWGPVTPVGPGVVAPTLGGGPFITSPAWSCGSKIILSVTVTDPNGVASVWGSVYVNGAKQGFTMSSSGGNVWSTTILNGDAGAVTSLVVYAKDGAGNNESLAIGAICS